jgi:hypothetical protein
VRRDVIGGLIVVGFVVVGLAAYQVGTLASPAATRDVPQSEDIMVFIQDGVEVERWWFRDLPDLTSEPVTVRVHNTVFHILLGNMTCMPDPERFYLIPCGYVVTVDFPDNAKAQFTTSVERSSVTVTDGKTIASIGVAVIDGEAVKAMIRTEVQDSKSTVYLLAKQ